MLERAAGAGMPFAWFTADEVYGQAPYLREWLEDRDVFYVLAIRCRDAMAAPGGPQRADALIAALPARAWRPGRDRWLLAHRSLKDPYDIAYYACYGPRRSRLVDLAWTAGSCWHVEMGHRWCRSSCAAFSWLCSLPVVGFACGRGPAGACVEPRGACPALA
jgi:hypothetical protein